MTSIHVVTNPRSGKNKKNPQLFSQMINAANRDIHPENTIITHSPSDFEELNSCIQEIHDSNGDILCIHGGDGTIHQVMTAVWRVYGRETPYPKIAMLKGGTMNNIARNLGVTFWSTAENLLCTIAQNGGVKEMTQSPLVVDNDLSGFIFGNVAVGPFMHEYDTGPELPSPWKGFRMFGQVVLSAIFGTSYSKRFIAPVPLKLSIDDDHRPLQEYTMLGISTLADVGFYCKPFHEAVHHNDKLHCLAMQCPPLHIILSVPKLWTARPTNKPYILDRIGETIIMEYNATLQFTIDGDNYTSGLRQEVTLGPPVQFLHL